MNTRIWEDSLTLEIVENDINAYFAQDIVDLSKKNILQKWNYFSIISILTKEEIQKFLDTVSYIDGLLLTKEQKIQYILTLAYVLLKEKMDISKFETRNIFLLISYLDNLSLKSITSSFHHLNNDTLLRKIRLKTLDEVGRFHLIEYIDKMKKPIDEMIRLMDNTEYYELVKMMESLV